MLRQLCRLPRNMLLLLRCCRLVHLLTAYPGRLVLLKRVCCRPCLPRLHVCLQGLPWHAA